MVAREMGDSTWDTGKTYIMLDFRYLEDEFALLGSLPGPHPRQAYLPQTGGGLLRSRGYIDPQWIQGGFSTLGEGN